MNETREYRRPSTYSKYSVPKPTLQDVEDWCKARMSPVDPIEFFAYYEETGWRTKSGEPISNWRQTEITWEINELKRIERFREKRTNKSSNPFLRYIQENEA
jgi:hypothetical protein